MIKPVFLLLGITISSALAHNLQPIFPNDLYARIKDILDDGSVVGYSVGVFRAGAKIPEEYVQWGLRTEAGAPVTEEVNIPSYRST